MGREKPNHPRRPRRTPSEIVQALADEYRCGHCHSETRATKDENGIHHMWISHDDGCPVLNGAVSPMPDTLRAIDRAS